MKANPKLLHHYLSFGTFTYPGLYKQKLIDDLPDDVRKIGLLVRQNIIHRTTLEYDGNSGTNADLRFGDMTEMPWWRQPEDDILPTAGAMLTELYRRDDRGFVSDRSVENKLVLTCRFVAILTASILKSKGIPARVRSGNAGYFAPHPEFGKVSWDHWTTQYWNDKLERWITIDVDGSLSLAEDFDPYDMPDGTFDFPGKAWLDIRAGKVGPDYFYNAGDVRGAVVVAWSLFYDFHSIMNDENIYLHIPKLVKLHEFPKLTAGQLKQIDELAELMADPDKNFEKLAGIFETNKAFRLFSGALL
jgi:hypothetical protein